MTKTVTHALQSLTTGGIKSEGRIGLPHWGEINSPIIQETK
ncbi:MAG TPA: hypothetical protein VJ987_11415 [Anaerolineales bacterium]|nr:hypothetical protein [Anaerolineales bacterium]